MAETTSAHPLPSLVEVHEEWKQYLLYNRIHRDAFTFTEFLTQKFTADEIEEMLNEPPMDVVVADSEQEAKTVNSDDGVRGEECQ